MSKETYFFSHDYNVRTDPKIKGLIRKHGMAGYGIFWAIVEDLYNNANALQTDYGSIAFDLRTDSKVIESIINDFDLFSIENGNFGSKSIERRLDKRNEKSQRARESAFKRWGKANPECQLNANASNNNANEMQSESDGNALKDNIREDIIKDDNVSFENFWSTYGKNIDREDCESLWNNLTESERIACNKKLPSYIESTPDIVFRKHPINYLLKKSWNSEIPSLRIKPSSINNSANNPSDINLARQIFKPPTVEEVTEYCKERNSGIDPIAFMNHYETIGWRYGNGTGKPVKDWKACIRTWEDKKKKESTRIIELGQRPGQRFISGNEPATFKKN